MTHLRYIILVLRRMGTYHLYQNFELTKHCSTRYMCIIWRMLIFKQTFTIRRCFWIFASILLYVFWDFSFPKLFSLSCIFIPGGVSGVSWIMIFLGAVITLRVQYYWWFSCIQDIDSACGLQRLHSCNQGQCFLCLWIPCHPNIGRPSPKRSAKGSFNGTAPALKNLTAIT